MNPAYAHELRALADVYDVGATSGSEPLSSFIASIGDRAALFVGSGGSFPVAQLAADLHERFTGRVSRAVTPLEFSWLPPAADAAVLMFSASGRHPDAITAAITAREGGYSPVGLITRRTPTELPAVLRGRGLQILSVLPNDKREGFLATSSVLAMATAVAHAYAAIDAPLAPTLTYFSRELPPAVKDRLLVLYAPGQAAAAADLETRFHETGLAAVQLADYRNFAHGRHLGLARNLSATTVVALIAEPYVELADATLAALPRGTDILRLSSPLTWPSSILDLIVASTRLAAGASQRHKLNLTRPGVAAFGRRLYHMSPARVPAGPAPGPIEKKLAELGSIKRDPSVRRSYAAALARWLPSLTSVAFKGVVLDYDGTCCATENRFEPAPKNIQDAILGILRKGAVVGFASGRGTSLRSELVRWVPKRYRPAVYLGLYNGGLCYWLDEDPPPQPDHPALVEAHSRLVNTLPSGRIDIKARPVQLSLRPRPAGSIAVPTLASSVSELLLGRSPIDVRIVASAHSVDVVPRDSSKATVLTFLQGHTGAELMAIGDQGQWGGNDFELLSATSHSLSVDRCSSDPSRCWNLGDGRDSGPLLLVKYLNALQQYSKDSALRFRWGTRERRVG